MYIVDGITMISLPTIRDLFTLINFYLNFDCMWALCGRSTYFRHLHLSDIWQGL